MMFSALLFNSTRSVNITGCNKNKKFMFSAMVASIITLPRTDSSQIRQRRVLLINELTAFMGYICSCAVNSHSDDQESSFLCATWVFITVFIKTHLSTLPWASSFLYLYPKNNPLRSNLKLSSHLNACLRATFSCSGLCTKTLHE
jgi:hypothetical protein